MLCDHPTVSQKASTSERLIFATAYYTFIWGFLYLWEMCSFPFFYYSQDRVDSTSVLTNCHITSHLPVTNCLSFLPDRQQVAVEFTFPQMELPILMKFSCNSILDTHVFLMWLLPFSPRSFPWLLHTFKIWYGYKQHDIDTWQCTYTTTCELSLLSIIIK